MALNLFCKTTDNSFSLEKYRNNGIFMIGDEVEIASHFFIKRKGIVVGIIKPEPVRTDKFNVKWLQVKINGKTNKYCPKNIRILNRNKVLLFDTSENHTFWKKEIIKDPFEVFETKDKGAFDFVASDFKDGLLIIQTDLPETLAFNYFKRSFKRGAHILKNKLLENSKSSLANDSQKIEILRSFAYSEAFISNEFDNTKLILASDLIKKICAEVSSGNWWARDQDLFLSAVRALIVANDFDTAREFIKSKRSFSKHLDQKRILTKLLRKTKDPKEDIQLKRDCCDFLEYTYFNGNAYYSSYFSSWYTFIEWNVIYYKFFISSDLTINWKYIYNDLKGLKHNKSS